jgi:hypothetical protein
MPCRPPATLQLPSSRPRFRPELVDGSLLRLGFVRSNFKRIYECKGFYGPRETRNGSSDPPTWCEFVPCTILINLGRPSLLGLVGWPRSSKCGAAYPRKKNVARSRDTCRCKDWTSTPNRYLARAGSKGLFPGQNDIVDQVHKSQHMYLSLSHTHTKVAWYSDILD